MSNFIFTSHSRILQTFRAHTLWHPSNLYENNAWSVYYAIISSLKCFLHLCILWTWLVTISPRCVWWGLLWKCGVPGPLLRVIWSLQRCVRILSRKSSTFSVGVRLRQGCPLSLLFVDDVVLLPSSNRDLQVAQGAVCSHMTRSGWESALLILCLKTVGSSLQVWRELLP